MASASPAESCTTCAAGAKDYDSHPTCWKHRDCINMNNFTWKPSDCAFCSYILKDHEKKPDKSTFTYLINKLVRGRKSLKLTCDDVFTEPQPLVCANLDAFKAALQNSSMSSSLDSSSRPVQCNDNKRRRLNDSSEEGEVWEDVNDEEFYEDLEDEQEAPEVECLDEFDNDDWFMPVELDEERKAQLKKVLARTRGVYKSLFPELGVLSCKDIFKNDPNFAFPLSDDSSKLIDNAMKPDCKFNNLMFDLNKLSFVNKLFPELQEFCMDNIIRADAGTDLSFLNKTIYLNRNDRVSDRFMRKDLLKSIFIRELSLLIFSALQKGSDKPRLMEALTELAALLLEVSSVSLFSNVKKAFSFRRGLRRKIFGSHKSSVAAKLIDSPIIAETLFTKSVAEKACSSMGLRTVSVFDSSKSFSSAKNHRGGARRKNFQIKRGKANSFRGSSFNSRGKNFIPKGYAFNRGNQSSKRGFKAPAPVSPRSQ